MAGLRCPKCGHTIELFGTGGGIQQAKKMNISLLGSIPIEVEARILADQGKSILFEKKENKMSIILMDIVKEIENILSS